MRREGSALAGAGTVMMKELGDNLSSTRMRLLESLVFLTGAGAVFATIGEVREVVGEDPFVFLRIFTTAKGETLPSFAAFLGFLIPIVAIVSRTVTKMMELKEKQLQVQTTMTAEKAAQYASHVERLEQRVRVLERIITDKGVALSDEIEQLRDSPVN